MLGAGKNICMSNNDYSSIKKLSEWPEQSSFRERKKHSYVWLACGTKADTILAKSPRTLPCPFLTINLLSIFDPCPGSWSKTPDNFGAFFSFIGVKTIKAVGKDILKKLQKSISKNGHKGLSFCTSALLQREEGIEIGISHNWSMIQSICLFSQTSLKIY